MEENAVVRGDDGYYTGTWQGKKIREVSVTTALKLIVDYSMVDPIELEKAANFGRAVHDMIDMYERGRLDRTILNNDLRKILALWMKCKAENDIIVEQTETAVVSLKYHYAGRLDVIARIKGVRCVIELKSREFNPVADPLQVVAYKQAFNESNPKDKALKTYFCGFDHKRNTYRFFEIKKKAGLPDYFQMFLCALALKKWEGMAHG